MVARDCQFMPAIGGERTPQPVRLDTKVVAAKRMLDCHFAKAGGTKS
jgi:hypothetical protein